MLPLFKQAIAQSYTENDYLQINYHYETGAKQEFIGRFIDCLSKGCTTFWQFEQTIRLIPIEYVQDDALYQEFLNNPEMCDEYELHYVHNWRCTYDEIKGLFVDIGNAFIDPNTAIISSETRIRPIEMGRLMQLKDKGAPMNPKLAQQINFYWKPELLENWEFLDRPLTSSHPHTTLGI